MIILNYHDVSTESLNPYVLSVDSFRLQIEFLLEQNFTFVTYDQISDPSFADGSKTCAITFDDGTWGTFKYGARILEEHDIRATYFICTDYAAKKKGVLSKVFSEFMGWEQIKDLKMRGNVIGSHGKTHISFFECSDKTLLKEISESKETIERKLGGPCFHLAAPYGEINVRVIKTAQQCHYKTLSSTICATNKSPYRMFLLRRAAVLSSDGIENFKMEISRLMEDLSKCKVLLLATGHLDLELAKHAAHFDKVICFDSKSYEFCRGFGLNCSDYRPLLNKGFKDFSLYDDRDEELFEELKKILREDESELVARREIMFSILSS